MDSYYLSIFLEKFPHCKADDFIVLQKNQGIVESFFIPAGQLILFLCNHHIIGFMQISPFGKICSPELSSSIRITSKRKDTIEINIDNISGDYTVIKGLKENNKSKLVEILLGEYKNVDRS